MWPRHLASAAAPRRADAPGVLAQRRFLHDNAPPMQNGERKLSNLGERFWPLLFAIVAGLVLVVGIRGFRAEQPSAFRLNPFSTTPLVTEAPSPATEEVSLADGSTLVLRPGTVAFDFARFLNGDDPAPQSVAPSGLNLPFDESDAGSQQTLRSLARRQHRTPRRRRGSRAIDRRVAGGGHQRRTPGDRRRRTRGHRAGRPCPPAATAAAGRGRDTADPGADQPLTLPGRPLLPGAEPARERAARHQRGDRAGSWRAETGQETRSAVRRPFGRPPFPPIRPPRRWRRRCRPHWWPTAPCRGNGRPPGSAPARPPGC